MEEAIVVDSLTKLYDSIFGPKVLAVDNVSFDVRKAEIFGFLGPNGAGKTTTIKMLTTVLRPTKGTARIFGYDIIKNPEQVRKRIVVVQQKIALDTSITVYDALQLYAKLHGVSRRLLKERVNWALDQFGLDSHEKIDCACLSGGFGRRVQTARAFICDADLMFLDEPTQGLDPESRRMTLQLIRDLSKQKGITVFITTQDMRDAEVLCDRIAVINHGKITAIGTFNELKKIASETSVIDVMVVGSNEVINYSGALLQKIPDVQGVRVSNGLISINVDDGDAAMPKIMGSLVRHRIKTNSVSIRKPTLEDVFIKLTGKGEA